ncbi:MAG: hypothetical protein RLZZ127_419 [Planctomycetota bacterium]|jgi:hypothetical protein
MRRLLPLLPACCLAGDPPIPPEAVAAAWRTVPAVQDLAGLAGLAVDHDLGTKRVNWTNARWTVRRFERPLDLPAQLELAIRSERPRSDAGAYVAIRDAGGCWWVRPWASELTAAENRAVIRLSEFSRAEYTSPEEPSGDPKNPRKAGSFADDDGILEGAGATAIAFGTINPFGVGRVAFTVAAITGTQQPEPPAAPMPPARIAVGGLLDADGTTTVAPGLFGSYNMPKAWLDRYRLHQDREMHHDGLTGKGRFGGTGPVTRTINTIGDRVRPSPRLTEKDWKAKTEAFARQLAGEAKAAGTSLTAEYWNEPYLNWANRNRAGFNPRFFDGSKAVEGGPVHIAHDGMVAPHLRWTKRFDAPLFQWTRIEDWRRGRDDKKAYSTYAPPYGGMEWLYGGRWEPWSHPPKDVPDGATYTAKTRQKGKDGKQTDVELTLTAFTPWHIHDETQFTYWSGAGMAMFYNEPMVAFGAALKAVDPKATYLAGWQHRPGEDNWAAWDLAYRPTIDAGIAVIDGVTDHDYGGDPRRLTAQAAVIRAYGLTRHRKALTSWNTECNASGDPQAMPGADAAAKKAASDRAKRRWTATKIVHALDFAPAVMRSFTHFGDSSGGFFTQDGDGVAMTQLIALRGRLMAAQSSDPDLLVAASVDGTDPLAPKTATMAAGLELVVAVVNQSDRPRTAELALTCPPGTRPAGPARRIRVEVAESGDRLVEEPAGESADTTGSLSVASTIPARDCVVWRVPLAGALAADAPATVVRRTWWSDAVINRVTPGTPVQTEIATDATALTRAWLELGLEKVDQGEGWIEVAGTRIDLPQAVPAENTTLLVRVPLDAALVKPRTPVAIRCAPGRAGFTVTSIAIVGERGGAQRP